MKASGIRYCFGFTCTTITVLVCALSDFAFAREIALTSRLRPLAALAQRVVRPQGVAVNPNALAISAIPDQVTGEATPTPPIPFTLTASQGRAAGLQLAGLSSNPALIPNENIIFVGNGANRTLILFPVPRQIGTAGITVSLTNAVAAAIQQTFSLTVTGRPPVMVVQPVFEISRSTRKPKLLAVSSGAA